MPIDYATRIIASRNRIDALIGAWFFAPQPDLHGLTPRDIIRNEQLDRPNVVLHDHLDELFFDDCPICQMMREEALSGEGGEWHFGLAPETTLIDEVDHIYDEAYRIERDGGPYADTFIVELPQDHAAWARLYELFEYELGERQGLELDQYKADNALIFWWDFTTGHFLAQARTSLG